MKSFMNNSAADKQDLLFFEYLEGELSGPQKSALEEKISLDPDLLEEVSFWEESFIEQDFYNTEKLEARLLDIPGGQVKSWYSYVSLNVFLMVLLSGLFSFLPLSEDEEKLIPAAFHGSGKAVNKESYSKSVPVPAMEAEKRKPNFKVHSKAKLLLSIGKEIPAETELPDDFTKLKFPAMSSMAPEREVSVPELQFPAPEVTTASKGKVSRRTISRKEERKILRKKEKAIQNRQAREFMKGKRAYVVPLNTENF